MPCGVVWEMAYLFSGVSTALCLGSAPFLTSLVHESALVSELGMLSVQIFAVLLYMCTHTVVDIYVVM